ncbi:MurR/RpiR family transcriptional regulator (plasmid) [Photobacterium sp. DA100]|uniref:MurR/RpiR family transcriptional regulator n=1 Tax=Photobacterium sp. DA100 TaxID=3027472 RepID=UPI00247AC374|nr:MurR/RpiR family transcriptional regulator [Photobacterium sp. DA100]WEM44526.1 MurR/RpiR family transcriptional regulator [Photobacterium sp. DA100]
MIKDFRLLFEYARLKFTNTDQKIADYFLALNPTKNIEELAAEIGVSTASITRFCKKLGLNNFKEFLYLYQNQLDSENPEFTETRTLQNEYFEMLQQFDQCLIQDDIDVFCELIHKHRVIYVFGLGYSAFAAHDLKFRLTRLGKCVEIVHDNDSIEMISSIIGEGELVLLLSLKGNNNRMVQSAKRMKEKGVKLLCITANESSRLLDYADNTLLTVSLKGEESTGMISGQLPMLIAFDHIYFRYVSLYRDSIQKWVRTEQSFEE